MTSIIILVLLGAFMASPLDSLALAQDRPLDSRPLARERPLDSTALARDKQTAAQDTPAPVGEFAAGVLMFPDEGVVTEGFAGGAARFYLSPRLSVGPEVAYISGDNHSHLMLTGNMTFDFLRPENGRPRPVTPFVVVGGGLFRSREVFPGNQISTHNEGAFTAGGGVRASIADRVVAGVEARMGWETHIRLNGFIGFSFK